MNELNFKDIETKFSGVWLRENKVFSDTRGTTSEVFSIHTLPLAIGEFEISQILESQSSKGVIRGIHYSDVQNPQIKVVRCISGEIRDCVIDLRPGSETFGDREFFNLSEESNRTLIISAGFGHAYEVTSKKATVLYAIQTSFNFSLEYSINPLDPELALPWETSKPILSTKDASGKSFSKAANEIQNGAQP